MENNNKKPPKKINISSYWIYGLIILVMVVMNISLLVTNKTKTITQGRFYEIVQAGDVDKVEVVNKNNVNVYLKEDVIEEKYQDLEVSKISE